MASSMPVRVWPHEAQHRDKRLDALRTVVAMDGQPPQVPLVRQCADDVAKVGLVLLRHNQRDEGALDRLDRMIPGVRRIRGTTDSE